MDTYIGWLAAQAAGFGQWLPIGSAVDALGFVLVCLGIGLTIKIVRIVASFLTAGGGSAA